jgi:acyl-CoA synthetase (AMP-forming)/AMP-acid ligase II
MRLVDGELQLRCPMLLRCYRDGSDPLTADGWFATGDLADIDADGLLSVHGRRGDLIITGGENVWPEPVEAVLRELPAITDVAVVGVPDEEWGATVTAVVVPADAAQLPSLSELRESVKVRLAGFHAPRRVIFVDSLPRTTLGKLRRSEVAETARIACARADR